HIWLRCAQEFDRSVIYIVSDCAEKSRIRREIGVAADVIYCQARHLRLRSARCIELGNLSDGRHLAQQTNHIEAPFLEVLSTPGQLSRPRQLPLNFLNKLAYSQCRSFSLLALNAHEQSLLLFIVEPNFQESIGDQCRTNNRNEQRDILPK